VCLTFSSLLHLLSQLLSPATLISHSLVSTACLITSSLLLLSIESQFPIQTLQSTYSNLYYWIQAQFFILTKPPVFTINLHISMLSHHTSLNVCWYLLLRFILFTLVSSLPPSISQYSHSNLLVTQTTFLSMTSNLQTLCLCNKVTSLPKHEISIYLLSSSL
jgi:hypothetical protein